MVVAKRRGVRTAAVLGALLGVALRAGAADTVAEASYLDGTVDVYRGGRQLDAGEVQIGSTFENYDIVRTARDGTLELVLTAGPSPETTIRVDPNTSFTVEVGKVKSQPKTTVNMISGTIGLKVRKIAGSGSVDVKTESAVMGVRGTEFSVTTPPSGDILITCSDGEVTCRDEDGSEVSARPGAAVAKIAGERLKSIPVAISTLEAFRKQWYAERVSALRSNAGRAIQNYAARYDELKKRFDSEYSGLMQHADVLNSWIDEDERGQTPGMYNAQTMSQKKRVVGSLLKLRATLFLFERVYFRLVELEDYHREGYGRGRLADGTTTDQFFARLEQERAQLARRLSRVQYAARLYAARNDGEFPAGLFGDSEDDFDSSEDDFDMRGWSDDE